MVGKILKVEKNVGDRVDEDEVVLVMEAMKMEIPVVAPASGVLKEIKVSAGQAVEAGGGQRVLGREQGALGVQKLEQADRAGAVLGFGKGEGAAGLGGGGGEGRLALAGAAAAAPWTASASCGATASR